MYNTLLGYKENMEAVAGLGDMMKEDEDEEEKKTKSDDDGGGKKEKELGFSVEAEVTPQDVSTNDPQKDDGTVPHYFFVTGSFGFALEVGVPDVLDISIGYPYPALVPLVPGALAPPTREAVSNRAGRLESCLGGLLRALSCPSVPVSPIVRLVQGFPAPSGDFPPVLESSRLSPFLEMQHFKSTFLAVVICHWSSQDVPYEI